MAVIKLAAARIAPGQRFYLDTSALLVLAHDQAQACGRSVPSHELARARQLKPFLQKIRAAKGSLRTSVLAFEEIAAKTRNDLRASAADKAGYRRDWKAFKRADQKAFDVADANAQVSMLAFLGFTKQAAQREHIEVERCHVEKTHTLLAEERLRVHHQNLLQAHRALDAMDALHIAVGLDLSIRSFVTFDRGWDSVSTIDVYSDR